jgi:hypothetical protein
MTKPTYDHHTLNPAGGFEPFEAFDLPNPNPSPNPDALETVQVVDPTSQRFFTLSQACKIFGKTPRTMRWWADTGRIHTVKIGHARFITEAEIQRLLRGEEG